MAWRSSGSSNEALINNLARNGLIESDRVKEAMLKVHSPYITYCPSSLWMLKG
jgi:protein-L-isoaspartate(D-aspartate) O-methyltransferase